MLDGFWYGIFGGLFGPVIAQWLSRFKYWVIFLVGTMGMYLGLFIALLFSEGLQFTIKAMLKNIFTPAGILVPMGAGIFAVFVAFLGSLNSPKKSDHGKN